jgi:hypothetical protein
MPVGLIRPYLAHREQEVGNPELR